MAKPIRAVQRPPAAMGIDPSLTGFALCSWVEGSEDVHFEEYKTKPIPGVATSKERRNRYIALINMALDTARVRMPRLIAVEGYAFAAGKNGVFAGELGMLLRDRLITSGFKVVEIPPNTLKKFATGKGIGTKAAMTSALANRHQIEFKTDNQADAFALLLAAKILAGLAEPLKREEQALAKVRTDV